VTAGGTELQSTFRALASPRRRVALRCLQAHRTVVLADLAEYVAEREADASVVDIPPERVQRVYFSLYHRHVPALEDADLVRYDQEADVVTVTERTSEALAAARDAIDDLARA
jgi:hypothetical protein